MFRIDSDGMLSVEFEGEFALVSPSALLFDERKGLIVGSSIGDGLYTSNGGRVAWLGKGVAGIDSLVRDQKGLYYATHRRGG